MLTRPGMPRPDPARARALLGGGARQSTGRRRRFSVQQRQGVSAAERTGNRADLLRVRMVNAHTRPAARKEVGTASRTPHRLRVALARSGLNHTRSSPRPTPRCTRARGDSRRGSREAGSTYGSARCHAVHRIGARRPAMALAGPDPAPEACRQATTSSHWSRAVAGPLRRLVGQQAPPFGARNARGREGAHGRSSHRERQQCGTCRSLSLADNSARRQGSSTMRQRSPGTPDTLVLEGARFM
jgi:hypothetical protein